jgi:hypothetical protein
MVIVYLSSGRRECALAGLRFSFEVDRNVVLPWLHLTAVSHRDSRFPRVPWVHTRSRARVLVIVSVCYAASRAAQFRAVDAAGFRPAGLLHELLRSQ